MRSGNEEEFTVNYGDIQVIPLGAGDSAEVVLNPAGGLDVGAGKGTSHKVTVAGGVVGIILDCRGRKPFSLPQEKTKRIEKLHAWYRAMDLYPGAF